MRHTTSKTPQWALDAINVVREGQLTDLVLSGYDKQERLIAFPPEILELSWLKTLSLQGNQLTYIPDNITQLLNLQKLNLASNSLKNLPASSSQLDDLEYLSLRNNQFTDLPDSICQLSRLNNLDLSSNDLKSIPESLAHLVNLQKLDLSTNLLKVVPKAISELLALQDLDLRNNQLVSIPEEVGKLLCLEKLNLSKNRLKIFPDQLEQLCNLQELDLRSNKLSEISRAIGKLQQLKILGLSRNQLTVLPEAVASLSNLRELYISNNNLVGLENSISKLQNLVELHLGSNQISALPESMSNMRSLRELYLSNNKLITVPDCIQGMENLTVLYLSSNELNAIPQWLINLPKISILYLGNNPIIYPPMEIFALSERGKVNIYKAKSYYQQAAQEGTEYLNEAKLLIVGEPGAGKTSLTRKLIDPAANMPRKDESTDGIDIHTWAFPLLGDDRNDLSPIPTKFQVNIWDFGGQEIYHATHQFFLSRRSLYIVVADAREQKTDFFHWLDLIEHLSDRSPVFIFNNAFQNRLWAINEQQLQEQFPETFQKPFAFNLADDEAGLAYLRQKIQEKVTQLPHVGDVLPRTWVNVRRALESDIRATVTQEEFLKLCKENGFARTDDALQLSGYLHDLGVILHFQDDPLLKHTVILKPEWGTDAVYRVLDNERVKANLGFFSRAVLSDIWYEDEYAMLCDELLALMMKFQLCYAIPNQKSQYIAPQLLSEQPPNYDFTLQGAESTGKSLYLRYRYEAFMPKGLLTRLIVAMHSLIATNNDEQLVWRTGVVLEKDGTRAEVVEFYHRREIRIRVTGKNMRDFLTIISYQLDELHRPFHRLKFDKLIPCNCTTCRTSDEPYFYRLVVLKTRLEHDKEVIECDVPPFETVNIHSLLDDVGAATRPVNLPSLLRILNRTLNLEEFKTLCFDMNIDFDTLQGEGLIGKQREFLLLLKRSDRLVELVNLLS